MKRTWSRLTPHPASMVSSGKAEGLLGTRLLSTHYHPHTVGGDADSHDQILPLRRGLLADVVLPTYLLKLKEQDGEVDYSRLHGTIETLDKEILTLLYPLDVGEAVEMNAMFCNSRINSRYDDLIPSEKWHPLIKTQTIDGVRFRPITTLLELRTQESLMQHCTDVMGADRYTRGVNHIFTASTLDEKIFRVHIDSSPFPMQMENFYFQQYQSRGRGRTPLPESIEQICQELVRGINDGSVLVNSYRGCVKRSAYCEEMDRLGSGERNRLFEAYKERGFIPSLSSPHMSVEEFLTEKGLMEPIELEVAKHKKTPPAKAASDSWASKVESTKERKSCDGISADDFFADGRGGFCI